MSKNLNMPRLLLGFLVFACLLTGCHTTRSFPDVTGAHVGDMSKKTGIIDTSAGRVDVKDMNVRQSTPRPAPYTSDRAPLPSDFTGFLGTGIGAVRQYERASKAWQGNVLAPQGKTLGPDKVKITGDGTQYAPGATGTLTNTTADGKGAAAAAPGSTQQNLLHGGQAGLATGHAQLSQHQEQPEGIMAQLSRYGIYLCGAAAVGAVLWFGWPFLLGLIRRGRSNDKTV